jgi:hypothetical protein
MSATFRRHTFVVVQQGDGKYMAYEEDKDGPAGTTKKVPSATADQSPYRAIAQLCQGLDGDDAGRIP